MNTLEELNTAYHIVFNGKEEKERITPETKIVKGTMSLYGENEENRRFFHDLIVKLAGLEIELPVLIENSSTEEESKHILSSLASSPKEGMFSLKCGKKEEGRYLEYKAYIYPYSYPYFFKTQEEAHLSEGENETHHEIFLYKLHRTLTHFLKRMESEKSRIRSPLEVSFEEMKRKVH